jgi:cytidylate kinase
VSRKERGLVIAIDGPSGAGKSTIARLLAKRLGYLQIDTGAMYRAVAVLMRRDGLDLTDNEAVLRYCSDLEVRLETVAGTQKVSANGQDVSSQIRTQEVSLMTSRISALKPVRDALLVAQRAMGRSGGVVLEGRDIGTVVFPDADLKFFLTASPVVRGKRRFDELIARGAHITLQETISAVVERDEQDSQRDIAPLRQAHDATVIDSSDIAIDEVVSMMERLVHEKMSQQEPNP